MKLPDPSRLLLVKLMVNCWASAICEVTWTAKSDSIEGATQFNFVSTNDIIGGNSGSPVVDKKGEVVGLIFDGNIQSLIGNYAYSEVQARSVSVDSRGILGALDQVYGAKRIVEELQAPSVAR